MAHQQHAQCIEACDACATACNHCAAACLQEPDIKMMAHCIALDMACADFCRLSSASMARGDEHVLAICALCADICQTCGEECDRHEAEHCKACAQACFRCADECRRMAGGAGNKSGAGAAAHAH